MGYVRHELGVRLRLKRIPALHVSLDDSAERGTRVLRIIEELEPGPRRRGRGARRRAARRDAADAGPAARREGDAEASERAEPANAAERRRCRGSARPDGAGSGLRRDAATATIRNRGAPIAAAPGRPCRGGRPMTAGSDLAALAAAVPDAVVERLRARPLGARRRAREPRRGRAGRGARDRHARRGARRAGHRRRQRRRAGPLRVPARGGQRPHRPGARTWPTTSWSCATAATSRGPGPIRERNAALFAATPLLTIDHHASNDGVRRPGLDRPGRGGDLRDGRPPRRRASGVPAHRRRRDAGRGPGRRDRDGHRHLRPPERDAAHARGSRPRSWRPARRCPRSAGASTARSPTPSWPSSAASWPGWSGTPTGS